MSLYGHEDGVQIRFDRRQGLPRPGPGNPPDRRSRTESLDTDLHDHGFIVIRRPGIVSPAPLTSVGEQASMSVPGLPRCSGCVWSWRFSIAGDPSLRSATNIPRVMPVASPDA